jgi:hypothetical protein
MIHQAPFFLPTFGPLGPTAGPGSHGTGSGSKNSAGHTNQPRPSLIPFVGTLCFLDRPQKDRNTNDKFEAPQGLPRGFHRFCGRFQGCFSWVHELYRVLCQSLLLSTSRFTSPTWLKASALRHRHQYFIPQTPSVGR